LQTIVKSNLVKLFQSWSGEEVSAFVPLAASGSNRLYFRIHGASQVALGVYNPDRRENDAFVYLASHLASQGLPVPVVLAKELAKDIYLVSDLGDVTLYSLISKDRQGRQDLSGETKDLYRKVVNLLPAIQIDGASGLDYSICYPRSSFDEQSMWWDLNYFKYYFVKLAGISFDEQKLEEDFKTLIDFLLSAGPDYFLFRDFQSRNIMIYRGEPVFIDFQGGRKGALQYDLASLLFDGKADLSTDFRQELLEQYKVALAKKAPNAALEFQKFFYPFVYVRILQAMGAYGFRGFYERKEHFLQSIPYALRNLEFLLQNEPLPIHIPELNHVLKGILASSFLRNLSRQALKVHIKSFAYKNGIPADTGGHGGGFVFDCRALPNPGRYPQYQTQTGKDPEVINFLEEAEEVSIFFNHIYSIVIQSIENYQSRGFSDLVINFGCTGGQHRSVYLAEKLARSVSQRSGLEVILKHRELLSSNQS